MASTASVPSVASLASGNAAGRPSMKSTATAKGSDSGRKQTASPGDGAQKRLNSQKVWTSGTNPITQRGNSHTQQNGNISHPKAAQSSKSSSQKETSTADKHSHDRLTFLFGAAIGLNVTITSRSGEKFEGIFSGATLESTETNVTLKMARRTFTASEGQTNGVIDKDSAFIGSGPDCAVTFEIRDIAEVSLADLSVPETVKATNGAASSFRTDADISGSLARAERPLERWVPETGPEVDLSLSSGGTTEWDQFETNKKLFGASSTYDENLYTTQIDRSAPSYKRREADAARLAREIEGEAATNAHMREERGQALEHDSEDEEDKFSGVRRDDLNFPPLASGAPNKYTPPARRAPTGQPTVAGAPVDPAIISAQMSRPDIPKAPIPKVQPKSAEIAAAEIAAKALETNVVPFVEAPSTVTQGIDTTPAKHTESLAVDNKDVAPKSGAISTSASPQRRVAADQNPTEDVENKVLDQFRQFANSEKIKYQERRRAQANHDRTAKLNDLLRFSKTFKLKTPVPSDLVGILAKDPAKQEQIVEKAQKEHEEQTSAAASPAASHSGSTTEVKSPSRPSGNGKFDTSTFTPLVADRQSLGRGRQGYPASVGRNDRPAQPQATYPGRGAPGLFSHRSSQQERKSVAPPNVPTPIPIHEGRIPPTGPNVDQSGLSSPQRSSVHTPTSAVSSKFNVKALEFKPNATAPVFNPVGVTNVSSSPRSTERTSSVSRAPSPSIFFGAKKPKPHAERPDISDYFNPIKRMKQEVDEQKELSKRDYSSNGGIPHAYQTPPTWDVKKENQDKSYSEAFEKTGAPSVSPAPSNRSASTHQIPYQHQVPFHLQNGQHNVLQVPAQHHTPQHMPASHHPTHFDDAHHRMHMPGGSPQVYPSPRLPSGQMVYSSPMGHPTPIAYGQPVPQYFANSGGPSPMPMRQYQGGPQFVHPQNGQLTAPMMVQQQSNGPYMGIPQQYNPQMPMYSPSPSHSYAQHVAPQPHSGYPSPSRAAPMMMHQGSQQGHHPGQQLMYAMPSQAGQMAYAQQAAHMPQVRGAYNQQQGPYASSPHQPHHFPAQPHRAPSSSYGQVPHKMMPQQMLPNQGPPPNTAQQQGVFAPAEMGVEDGK